MTWTIAAEVSKDGRKGWLSGKVMMLTHSDVTGALYVTGWAMGCSQALVQGFYSMYSLTDQAVDELIPFLDKLKSSKEGPWAPQRYLFTLTEDNLDRPALAYLASKAKLLDSYDNLAHHSSKVHLYMLNTKEVK